MPMLSTISRFVRGDRVPYESLPNVRERTNQQSISFFPFRVVLCACCFLLLLSGTNNNDNIKSSHEKDHDHDHHHDHHDHDHHQDDHHDHDHHHDEHVIPTLLSVVHPETGRYIYALENPLYEQLKRATFHHDHDQDNMLVLDRHKIRPHESLVLSWSTVTTEIRDDDVIVLYCGDDDSLFLEAASIAQARATSKKHGGTNHLYDWYIPSFPSIPHASSCRFVMYQTSSTIYRKISSSPILHLQDYPTGIHLAFGNDPSEMVVQFATKKSVVPVVMYGNSSNSSIVATGTSRTYSASDLCEEPANITEAGKFQSPGMLHAIKMTHLLPDTKYTYKLGMKHENDETIIWSSESYTFMSAPGNDLPFSYIAYADQGCPSNGWGDGGVWTSAMAAREYDIRAVHHFGDLSYAKGAAHIWDEWTDMISVFASRVPLMIGVGNHEYDHVGNFVNDPSGVETPFRRGNFFNDSGGECSVPASMRFVVPNNGNGIFWYSYDMGIVRTIVLSSEHDLSQGSTQYEWLRHELNNINHTKTPWVIVEMHRPLYEADWVPLDYAVGVEMRREMEHLLYDNVDVVLAGHYHSYHRTCDGLYRGRCDNTRAPIHITIGAAGAALIDAPVLNTSWTAKSIQGVFGYGRVTVYNATVMHFEFVRAGPMDDPEAGTVEDDVWIIRNRS